MDYTPSGNKTAIAVTCVARCALATALLAFVPHGAAAQDATLSGTWRHRGGEAERERRHRAIDGATENMGLIMRGTARDRLRSATAPRPELTIQDQGNRVTITTGGRTTALPTDGSVTRPSGDSQGATIRAQRRDGRLVVTAQRDGGTRTTRYHLSEDGQQLTLFVRVVNERLSAPLRFRLTYRRRP